MYENNCQHRGGNYVPNEIVYSDEKGLVSDVDSHIGFGGKMEPEHASEEKIKDLQTLWSENCKQKIDEAYEVYLEKSGLKKYVTLPLIRGCKLKKGSDTNC